MHGTGPITAQLKRDFLGSVVPGGKPSHENVHDGVVHVPIQLDAAVRERVRLSTAGRSGVLVRPVRGYAQSAGLCIPERCIPQGDAARDVQPFAHAEVHRSEGGQRCVPAAPVDVSQPAGQRVGAQFPYVIRRVPALVRLSHATTS